MKGKIYESNKLIYDKEYFNVKISNIYIDSLNGILFFGEYKHGLKYKGWDLYVNKKYLNFFINNNNILNQNKIYRRIFKWKKKWEGKRI